MTLINFFLKKEPFFELRMRSSAENLPIFILINSILLRKTRVVNF